MAKKATFEKILKMAYDETVAERLRTELLAVPSLKLEEKKMFGGLAFMVNEKMCINVSGNRLMCRYNSALQTKAEKMKGYRPMIMRGRQMKGFCYVEPEGFKNKKDFDWWVKLCLAFNKEEGDGKKRK